MLYQVAMPGTFLGCGFDQPEYDIKLMEARENQCFPSFLLALNFDLFDFEVQEISKNVEPDVL